MPSSSCEKRTFSLSSENGRYIDKQVKAGKYATASEVFRAGLRTLEERDAAVGCDLIRLYDYIADRVNPEAVAILRILYGGRNLGGVSLSAESRLLLRLHVVEE